MRVHTHMLSKNEGNIMGKYHEEAFNTNSLDIVKIEVCSWSLTLAVGALLRAFARSLRALSYSLFSDSSFTAASQISSLLGLAWKKTWDYAHS